MASEYVNNMATGAGIGAGAGTMVMPGLGTLIGGVGGGLLGLGYTAFGGGDLLGNLSGGNVNPNARFHDQSDLRKQQMMGVNTVGNWATTGNGPSQAQSLLTQAREQNNQNAVGAAKSMSGGNPALQANLMSGMLAKQNAQTGYQSAQLRAQEQQAAMDQYLKSLQGVRESDIEVGKAKTAVDVHNADAKGGMIKGILGGVGGGLGGLF